MVEVRLELHAWPRGGEQPRERRRSDRVLDPARRGLVAAARRRLADAHLGRGATGLQAAVDGSVELRVRERRYGLALSVVCRREELLEVRLVPDAVEPNVRVSRVSSAVARRKRSGERGDVGQPGRRVVRALAPVRPVRRAPDRQQALEPAELRAADELVEVVPPVGGVERIRRAGRPETARFATSTPSCGRCRRWRSPPRRALSPGLFASGSSGRPGIRPTCALPPWRSRGRRAIAAHRRRRVGSNA